MFRQESYQEAAVELGKELVERTIDLAYGAGSVGLMGVLGIIPKSLEEINGDPIGEVKTVSDMSQRKAEMARHADAFIALPGGYGTLEELMDVTSAAQLDIHRKPVGLLIVDGYYDSLLAFMYKAADEGFVSPTSIHSQTNGQRVRGTCT